MRTKIENREEMMDRVVLAVEEWIGAPVQRELVVNCHRLLQIVSVKGN